MVLEGRRRVGAIVAGLAVGALVELASAGAPIEVVVDEGTIDPVTASAIVSLNAPFTNGNGTVGFNGNLDVDGSTVRFIWFDDGIIFRATDALPTVLTGGEGTMGIGDAGEFVYSPSADGLDAVWTDTGLVFRDEDPAPGIPGQFITFASRPRMLPDGTVYVVAGLDDTAGGGTSARALYKVVPGETPEVVIQSGDLVDGLLTVDFPAGVDFDHEASDDDTHLIQVLLLDTGSTLNDGAVVVDGSIIAREAMPIDLSESWDNFDIVSINDAGEFVFTGDTDGVTTSDEFITHGACFRVREGDVVDGITLVPSASMRAASINNVAQVAHAWGVSGGDEHLFVGNAVDLASSSLRLLSTGDPIDSDGDRTADATVAGLNASPVIGPGIQLAEDGVVYLEVTLEDIVSAVEREAILRIPIPPLPCPEDIDVNGSVGFADLTEVLNNWGPCDCCRQDFNADGAVGFEDLTRLLARWGPCSQPTGF